MTDSTKIESKMKRSYERKTEDDALGKIIKTINSIFSVPVRFYDVH